MEILYQAFSNEINECNELILTELIYNNYLDSIDHKSLGALLSIFCDSKPVGSNDNLASEAYFPDDFKDYVDYVNLICRDYTTHENNLRLNVNYCWNINLYMIEPTYKWMNGYEFEQVSREYGLFEGNLIKDFLKIYNISAELEKAAEILNKTHLQVEAAKIRDIVVRDIVNIESLYIK